MSTDTTEHELGMATLQFLTRSRNRLRVLRRLCAEPATPATLRAELDLARTTLRRLLGELEERDLLYRLDATYHPMVPAGVVVSLLETTTAELDTARRLATFFGTIPPEVIQSTFDDFPVDKLLGYLDGIDVALPTQADPFAPQARVEDLLTDTESACGFGPTSNPLVGPALDDLVRRGGSCELILSPEAEQTVRERVGRLDVEEEADGFRLLLTEEVPKFGLLLVDDAVALVGFDEYYRTQAVVTIPAACKSVVGWAEVTYDRVRDSAVEPGEIDGQANGDHG